MKKKNYAISEAIILANMANIIGKIQYFEQFLKIQYYTKLK